MTEQEIVEAERAVEVAESRLDTAEAHHATAGSPTAVTELRAARADANDARDRLRRLKSAWAKEQADEARRAAAEAVYPQRKREALVQQLADARDEAAYAVAALDKAAAVALAAVAGYGAVVRQVSGELLGAGLRAGDGGVDGGTAAGTVHLGGETWRAADPGSLVAAVMQAAVAAHDRRHVFAQARWGQMGGLVEAQARAELLARAAGR
ncbi:hypothetical protein [Streptomyces sp. 11x1]|uniref:hypothetical protein n=1 Tax=Streptomyces sp. 11x1 TaxID=3038642 RepID=UPI0029309ED3|nr:hypothetical protein [Streptomyces sp. 11x1]WNZ11485.1 hypothetical protein P8T65_30665 [Streptomyces sp. 11x1]